MEKANDSSISHSACQILLEIEAESLKQTRSRMTDSSLSSDNMGIKGTASLFPTEPHKINGGMIPRCSENYTNQEVQQPVPLHFNELKNVVVQGSSRKTRETTFSQKKQQYSQQQHYKKQQTQKPYSKP